MKTLDPKSITNQDFKAKGVKRNCCAVRQNYLENLRKSCLITLLTQNRN